MRMLRRLSALLVLIAVAACGGSGGDGDGNGGGPPPVLAGIYKVMSLTGGFGVGGLSMASFSGAMDVGGAGTAEFDFVENADGTLATSGFDLSFTLAGDQLSFFDSTLVELLRGCLVDGGRVGLTATVSGAPRILAFVRCRSGVGVSAADLSGAYHFVALAKSVGVESRVGAATFDGAGGGSIPTGTRINNDGATGVFLGPPQPFTYSVGGNGTTTIVTNEGTHVGGLLEGGELIYLGGSTVGGEQPGVYAYLRVATTASNATFSGTYCAIGLTYDPSLNRFRSITGELVADGGGGATLQGTVNEDGTVSDAPAETATYTVLASGHLTVTTSTATLEGAVSEDGRFAIVGGATSTGDPPVIYLLARL